MNDILVTEFYCSERVGGGIYWSRGDGVLCLRECGGSEFKGRNGTATTVPIFLGHN